MRGHPEAAWCRASTWVLGLALVLAGAPAAQAGDYGVTGVLDTPTARMGGDGELTLTYSRKDIVDHFAIGYRPTPWLEAAFRYSIYNPRGLERSDADLRDRSAEVKVRLLRERTYLPQVAIGIRDLLGTGAIEAEYVVASKAFGPLDLSIGLGWGALAERSVGSNPLSNLDSSFESRTRFPAAGGGRFNPGRYFSGPDVGLFGSVRYDLPHWNLALKANYNSDNYAQEVRLGTVSDTDPISVGVEWAPLETFSMGASWQQGNSVALTFRATFDTGRATSRKPPNRYGAPGTRLAPSGRPGGDADWYRRMSVEAASSGVLVHSASGVDAETLQVVYANRDFQYEADAIRHVLSLAERYAPREYDTFLLTGRRLGGHTHSVRYVRPGLADSAADYPIGVIEEVVVLPTVVHPPKDPDHTTPFRYPNATMDLGLAIRPFLFDTEDPFRYQAVARIGTRVALSESWGFSTSWSQNLYSQFDAINQPSDSQLEPVRTDVVSYLQDGKSWLNHMVLTWSGQPADDFHVLAFGGILEQMYTGVGGEVLYRPVGSRFGIGANIIGVQQREFDGLFGLRDYQTVIGHISGYWASPFYNMDVAVHAGRYLARDWGATLEVQRRFANGWSVGAFATLTDVPFSEFGEGSFDKGLIFRVPFNLFTGFNTRDGYSTIMRPVQRDGGQRLVWGTTLWENLRSTGSDYLDATRGGMRP